ncbi:hypothetical protein EV1_007442 [Malus domestica]
MKSLTRKMENLQKKRTGSVKSLANNGGGGSESLTDSSSGDSRETSNTSQSSSETPDEELKRKKRSSPSMLGWPIRKAELCKNSTADLEEAIYPPLDTNWPQEHHGLSSDQSYVEGTESNLFSTFKEQLASGTTVVESRVHVDNKL